MDASSDEEVQKTNDDATICKRTIVDIGYYTDPYIGFFADRPKGHPTTPMTHRGYYTRVKCIHGLVRRFLSQDLGSDVPRQVVALGAGFDTLPLLLKDEGIYPKLYVEVDFENVVRKKSALIRKHPLLSERLGLQTAEHTVGEKGSAADSVEIHTADYHLVAADLRKLVELESKLKQTGIDFRIPTLFLSECVLIYMEPEFSDALISWVGSQFSMVVFVTYEQILPNDPYGEVMLRNLAARGCSLRSIKAYPTKEAQIARYRSSGFEQAVQVFDMNEITDRFLDVTDFRRIQRLEWLDEIEEWLMIQAHYCVVW
eukprot:CAMPEP_0177633928 /NCGR_PEP_ID=MMETSP0447-20121125/3099_1 /TAXON_ID=0 /ORGANISM="Stygamoeba regulata, Strain BSH-02190019" /LENGTH=313 /DNA_ID=CAMNT_0019135621 /DNA_START=6 /DNA_END=944 /DNA_ORIENTATION=+